MLIDKSKIVSWAAGLFEGEGTISVKSNRIRTCVEMTDYDVIKTLYDNFGGHIYEMKKRKVNWKKSWKWVLTNSQESCDFLSNILPFLHSRRSSKTHEALLCQKNWLEKQNNKKEQINKIRKEIEEAHVNNKSLTHKEISVMFNIDRSYVTHILNGKYK